MSQYKFKTTEKNSGMRLDSFLSLMLPDCSRASIQREIKTGHCTINDNIILSPSYKLHSFQEIILTFSPLPSSLVPVAKNVEILWKDNDILVCNKPAGISVHPAPSVKDITFIQHLLFHFPQLGEIPGQRPGVVHRLDKNTSGLLLVALNENTRILLSKMFSERKISKTYLAIVKGVPKQNGSCNLPIGRHEKIKTRMAIVSENKGGRSAYTEWKRLWHWEDKISLLEVKIHTGRTHQIRVHLSHLGFPIIGDEVYGNNPRFQAPRQMLHAWKLEFIHPFSLKQMFFSVQPPQDFIHVLGNVKKTTHKIIITGNVGCGKSSFCRQLSNYAIPVISADEIAARLYLSGGEAAEWLSYRFGSELLEDNGNVNKEQLFLLMERNRNVRKEIESVIQSYIKMEIEKFFEIHEVKNTYLAVAEVPLFFESDWSDMRASCLIVGIHCNMEERWKRLQEKRHWSLEKIRKIEEWQLPEKEKMEQCDYIINNSLENENLDQKVKIFLDWLGKKEKEEDLSLKHMLFNIISCKNSTIK